MQFAGMNRAKCLQCGGAKCITYSCACPYVMEEGNIVDMIPNDQLDANMEKLHGYLGV
jgi:hypothetical protein